MSDVVLVGLITGAVGIAGLLLNVWTQHQERSHALERLKLEHQERYRSDLYAKRLEVHQRAYLWLMQLIEPVRWVQDPKLTSTDMKTQLKHSANRARDWWDTNCLYLDDESRSATADFISLAQALGRDDPLVEEGKPIDAYLRALKSVQEGIGMKHLDVREPTRK